MVERSSTTQYKLAHVQPLPKWGREGIWQNPDMSKGVGVKTVYVGKEAAGQGGQDFCARENCVFPEIDAADLKPGRGRRGDRVTY